MDKLKGLKVTFQLTGSEVNRSLDVYNTASENYRANIRLGQHHCNFFKLSRMDGDNKKFEEILWEASKPLEVLELLNHVTDWSL